MALGFGGDYGYLQVFLRPSCLVKAPKQALVFIQQLKTFPSLQQIWAASTSGLLVSLHPIKVAAPLTKSAKPTSDNPLFPLIAAF